MLSIRREEKTYLCFRNRVTRTLSSGRGDHEFKLRTVSFSFRDSLILTFVSCSKSFKHPSIETYSIKQTTVNSKKDCKVTLQSFLERVTDLWVRIRFANRKLKSLLTHQLDHARFHHEGVCCAPRITRTNPQILQDRLTGEYLLSVLGNLTSTYFSILFGEKINKSKSSVRTSSSLLLRKPQRFYLPKSAIIKTKYTAQKRMSRSLIV